MSYNPKHSPSKRNKRQCSQLINVPLTSDSMDELIVTHVLSGKQHCDKIHPNEKKMRIKNEKWVQVKNLKDSCTEGQTSAAYG